MAVYDSPKKNGGKGKITVQPESHWKSKNQEKNSLGGQCKPHGNLPYYQGKNSHPTEGNPPYIQKEKRGKKSNQALQETPLEELQS